MNQKHPKTSEILQEIKMVKLKKTSDEKTSPSSTFPDLQSHRNTGDLTLPISTINQMEYCSFDEYQCPHIL